MEIKTQFTYEGRIYDVTHRESDPDLNQEGIKMDGVHAYCFYNGKMVLVYNESKKHWTPPGGAIEPGETWQEATIREIKEESNMKALHHECIGYQDIVDGNRTIRQVRSFCIVEPYGDFVSDPDEDITKIELIDPKYSKQYFDWGKIGDRILERSLELLQVKNKKSEKKCEKCKGTGRYMYDENHIKPCEVCCSHSEGWWKMEDNYGDDNGKYACKNGCGTVVNKEPSLKINQII